MSRRYLILGMGPAGLSAAETIRALDTTADILLVSDDAYGYYSRPGLAYYLTGELRDDALYPFTEQDFRERDLRRLQASAVALHPGSHQLELQDGRRLDYDRLLSIESETCRIAKVWNRDYREGQRLTCQELFSLDVDILIPGARPDVIKVENVRDIRARLLVEAANIPASEEAERYLADNGVLVVPDFVANAGGVIAGAVELRKGTLDECFQTIKTKIHENVNAVLDRAAGEGLYPRQAAIRMATDRVLTAMRDKGRL